jgi:membrane protein YdbS with pleckstrin-like domain
MTNYMKSTIKDPEDTEYDGEDNDERIYYVLRKSYLTNFPWIAITIIMVIAPIFIDVMLASVKFRNQGVFDAGFILSVTLFWYLGTFGFFLQNLLNWFFNVYIISTKKIVDVDFHGIMYKNISETTLDNVEDVTSTVVGALGMIFNIGDVFIQTAAERREFEFLSVDDPSKVRDLIADLAAEKRNDRNN